MGHVLVDFDWGEICQAFLQSTGIEDPDFRNKLSSVGRLGYEEGTISTRDFLTEVNKLFKTNIQMDEFHRLWNVSLTENKKMAFLLEQLKQKFPLYLLSNTNESHWKYLQNNFNVGRHFDEHILSFEVGSLKPRPQIYEEIFKRSGHLANECLFIDDLEENIEGAKKVGLHTVHYQGIEHLKKELSSHGIIVNGSRSDVT